MLDKDFNPKLIDFGISSIFDSTKKIFDTGGTPAYLAPEVVKAEGEVGFKSDVWSLGILLYLLTYGIVPFKAKDMQTLYNKIIIGKYNFPKYDNSSFELIDLIKKMLVVEVKNRIDIEAVLNHRWFHESNLFVNKKLIDSQQKKEIKNNHELKEGLACYLKDVGFKKGFI